jgi:hypothetical protein
LYTQIHDPIHHIVLKKRYVNRQLKDTPVRFVKENTNFRTPFSRLIDVKALCSRHAKSAHNEETIEWVDGRVGYDCHVRGKLVRVKEEWSAAVHMLEEKAMSLLMKLLGAFGTMRTSDGDCLLIDFVVDQVVKDYHSVADAPGACFLQCGLLSTMAEDFSSHFRDSPNAFTQYFEVTYEPNGTAVVDFNSTFRSAFIEMCSQLNSILAVVISMTWGQPARAPEVVSLLLRHGNETEKCLFLHSSHVMLTTRYHKSAERVGLDMVVPRFLPKESVCSKCFILYFGIIRPFEW